MVNIPEPDSYIKIGFKEGKMILVDWSEISEQFINKDHDEVIQIIVDYLELAKLFITKS